jgi:sRNA-binding carbon storage regulator CsrA
MPITNQLNFIEEDTMAFANEYLTDEAERKKYGSAHVTLDRERDAWLTRSGGAGRPDEFPQFVELHWQGEEIKMHAYEKGEGNAELGIEINWYVAKMSVPKELEIHRKEIIKMVRDALIAHKDHGYVERDHLVKNVNVEFSDHVINYKAGDPTWM